MEENHDFDEKTVFISYSSEKRYLAEQFHLELNNHHISNWFDREELPKCTSEEYKTIIHNRIKAAKLLLFLYSAETNESEFIINDEVGYAIQNKIPVFCFLLEDAPMSKRMKELLNEKQWVCNMNDLDGTTEGFLQDAVDGEKRMRNLQSLIDDKVIPTINEYNDTNLFLTRIAIQRFLGIPTTFGTYTKLEQSHAFYRGDQLDISVLPKLFLVDIPANKKDELVKLGFLKKDHKEDLELKAFYEKCEKESLMNQLVEFIQKYYSDSINDVKQYLCDTAEEAADLFIEQIKQGKKQFNGKMLGVCDIRCNRTCENEYHFMELDMYVSDYFTFKFTVQLYHKLRTLRNHFTITNTNQIKEYAPFLCSLGMGGHVVVTQNDKEYLIWTKRSNQISAGNIWHFSFDETVSLSKDVIRDKNRHLIYEGEKLKIDPYSNFYRGLYEELFFTKATLDNEHSGIFEIGLITSDRLELEFLSYATYHASPNAAIEEQLHKLTDSAIDGKLEISSIKYIQLENCYNELIGLLVSPEAFALYERIEAFKRNKMLFNQNEVEIEPGVTIGENNVFDKDVYLSKGCVIGSHCKIHNQVFIDEDVKIGNNVKIQNHNNLYHGLTVDDGVFIGPNVTFTNDKHPRSINPDGTLKDTSNWKCSPTVIGYGASLGGGSTVVCGSTVGAWAMVGAGAVVTKDVPSRALILGNPGTIQGWVSDGGERLAYVCHDDEFVTMSSKDGREMYQIPVCDYLMTDFDAIQGRCFGRDTPDITQMPAIKGLKCRNSRRKRNILRLVAGGVMLGLASILAIESKKR